MAMTKDHVKAINEAHAAVVSAMQNVDKILEGFKGLPQEDVRKLFELRRMFCDILRFCKDQ